MQPEGLLDCASRAEAWIARRRLTIRMARRVLRSCRLSSAVISSPAKRILLVVGSINRSRERASNQISMIATSAMIPITVIHPPRNLRLPGRSWRNPTSPRHAVKSAPTSPAHQDARGCLAQAAANLSQLDATLRLFDLQANPPEIRSKRQTPGRCFAAGELPIVGELPKACLTILRGRPVSRADVAGHTQIATAAQHLGASSPAGSLGAADTRPMPPGDACRRSASATSTVTDMVMPPREW
jgi:hypothetical protein